MFGNLLGKLLHRRPQAPPTQPVGARQEKKQTAPAAANAGAGKSLPRLTPAEFFADPRVWDRVASSNLTEIAYLIGEDAEHGTLGIRFGINGVSLSEYRYHGVPQHIYLGLLSAGSKGKYHNAHIKRAYPFDPVK